MKLATRKIRINLAFAMVVVLAIFLMPTFANATTWYVSPWGNDANDGTEDNPWRNIQYAVDQAVPGDTIKVMDDDDESTDDYIENIIVDKSLTVERYNDTGANPQIKAKNYKDHVFNVKADNVSISGLDIHGTRFTAGSSTYGIYLDSVSGCAILYNRCGWDSKHFNYLAIKLNYSSNNIISGNICKDNDCNIWLYYSSDNIVSDNTCSSNQCTGIMLIGSTNNTISGNTCNDVFDGIALESFSHNNIISDNTCSLNRDGGIDIFLSDNNTVSGNTCNSNKGDGIFLWLANNNTLLNNTCSLNKEDTWKPRGIMVLDSSNNILSDNTCSNNDSPGIDLQESRNNTLSGNTCNSNRCSGIQLIRQSNNNILSGNTCSSNSEYGIYLRGVNNTNVSGNVSNSNQQGIRIEGYVDGNAENNTISGNTCDNNGYGIYLYRANDNTLSGNTCSSNSEGIRLDHFSENNTLSGNTCSSNSSNGIYVHYSSDDNRIYLNNFRNNGTNVYDSGSNELDSPTKLGYLYGGSTESYKSFMGNYYDDYSGSDSNNDGIGDTPYDRPPDEYPLMQATDNYDLQTWWLANPIMYRGDMSQPGATVTVSGGSYQIWAADEATMTDISFGAGDEVEGTTWTGQITFAPTPENGDTFAVKVGYADDQDGSNFWEDGPEAMLVGNGSAISFTYATNALAITVPEGKYLALKITNDSSSDYDVRVGGSWSYVSAPLGISAYIRGDVSGNGTVSAYDAAMVLQYVVGLITLTDTQKEAADVSKDGTVSDYDAALILQYVIGLITSFPE